MVGLKSKKLSLAEDCSRSPSETARNKSKSLIVPSSSTSVISATLVALTLRSLPIGECGYLAESATCGTGGEVGCTIGLPLGLEYTAIVRGLAGERTLCGGVDLTDEWVLILRGGFRRLSGSDMVLASLVCARSLNDCFEPGSERGLSCCWYASSATDVE